MSANNKVIAGDYNGASVELVSGKVILSVRLGHMIVLNQKMVSKYDIVSETRECHTVSIQFSDGKKSLLEIDDALCKALLTQLF